MTDGVDIRCLETDGVERDQSKDAYEKSWDFRGDVAGVGLLEKSADQRGEWHAAQIIRLLSDGVLE